MKIDLLTGNRDYVYTAVALQPINKYGRYYRSKAKKVKTSLLFGSFMMNKKWRLEEEFNNHILRFQQVNISVWALFKQGKQQFDIPDWTGGDWSRFPRRTWRGAPGAADNGAFLFSPRALVSRTGHLINVFPGWDHHQMERKSAIDSRYLYKNHRIL